MKMRDYEIGGKHSSDPINSHVPRGKDTSKRKHRNDPGWTPTEEKIRNQLMRQFMKNPEGSAHADTDAYKNSPVWCVGCNGRRMAVMGGLCEACWPKDLPR